MSPYKQPVLPKFSNFDVEPCHVEFERPGMILEEDIELISSTIQMGMELMTFDKVIIKFIELIKAQSQE